MGLSDALLLKKDIEDLISILETLLKKPLQQSSEHNGIAIDSSRARFRRLQERYRFLECHCKALSCGETDESSLPNNVVGALPSQRTVGAIIAKEESRVEGKLVFCEFSPNSPSTSNGSPISHSVGHTRPALISPNPVLNNETGSEAFREAPFPVRECGAWPPGSLPQSPLVIVSSTITDLETSSKGGACVNNCVFSPPTVIGVKSSVLDSSISLCGPPGDVEVRLRSPSPCSALPASGISFVHTDEGPHDRALDDGLEEGALRDRGTWKDIPLPTLLQRFVSLKAGSPWRRFQSLPIPEFVKVDDGVHLSPGYHRDPQCKAAADLYGARACAAPVYGEIRTSTDEGIAVRAWQGRCAGCLTPLHAQSRFLRLVKFDFSGAARFCHYTNRYYCRACHQGEVSLIPSRLLWDWDATPFTVCDTVKDFWVRYQDKPFFAVGAVNPSLYEAVTALSVAHALRVQINRLWEVCIQCAHFRRLFYGDVDAEAWDDEAGAACYVPLAQRYYLEGVEHWSLSDLLELHRCCPGTLYPLPKSLPWGESSPSGLPYDSLTAPNNNRRHHDRVEVRLKYFPKEEKEEEEQHERFALALSHSTKAGLLRQVQTHCHGHLRGSRDGCSMPSDNTAESAANSLPSVGPLYASCSVLQTLHRVRQAMKWHLFQQLCGVCGYSRGCTTCQRHAADVCRLCCPADIAEDFVRIQVHGIEEESKIQKRKQRYQGHHYKPYKKDTFACGKERCGCGVPESDCYRSFLCGLPEAVLPFFVLSIDVLHVHVCQRCGAAYHKRCWQDSVSAGNSDSCKVCKILQSSTAREFGGADSESRS